MVIGLAKDVALFVFAYVANTVGFHIATVSGLRLEGDQFVTVETVEPVPCGKP
ncbi:hypothetical protein HMPREF6485_2183 [Segatella buccae ATCC 33574]|uniref:Uncharacterized protein n=1 Tax=Segatella buccae ATCC 33574 TaxID=873513 RepID=E6K997_9BACT|nr:hypothetical protein HMPREF6485_2183 [Segatella buccae ATCC 33574]